MVGTTDRATASRRAASSPRSTSTGGAMPRESERSSSTVSRAWVSAPSRVARASSGSFSSWVRARPRSIESRTSRCCGPSWMSRSRRRSDSASAARPAARPASERRTSCWSSARPQSRSCPSVECSSAAARMTIGRVNRATSPMVQITRTSAPQPAPKPRSEARVTGSVPRGMVRPQMAYVGPPIAAAHQAMRDRPRDRGGDQRDQDPDDVQPGLAVAGGSRQPAQDPVARVGR